MNWSVTTFTHIKAAFEMHDCAISTRQSMEKARRLRRGWALTPEFTDHILRKRLEQEDSMSRIEEACDAISIDVVLHSIQTLTAINWI
jgi:hypothetical protein